VRNERAREFRNRSKMQARNVDPGRGGLRQGKIVATESERPYREAGFHGNGTANAHQHRARSWIKTGM